jgi:hypothetical protein
MFAANSTTISTVDLVRRQAEWAEEVSYPRKTLQKMSLVVEKCCWGCMYAVAVLT